MIMSASIHTAAANEVVLQAVDDTEKSQSPPSDEEAGNKPQQESPLVRWNESPLTVYRFLTTLFSFIVMGMNDGAVGVST
jgi:hypothetical protein